MSEINTKGPKARRNYRKTNPALRRRKLLRGITGILRTVLIFAAVAGMSAAFIFGYDLFTQCDYFKATFIVIDGQKLLTAEQIQESSGIKTGVNLLEINLSVARKQLKNHPWIKEAEIRREFPTRMHIRVIEQKPLAILDLGQRFVMNTDGEIFKKWDLSDPKDLPVVSGLKYYDLKAGDDSGSIRFASVMEVLHLGEKPGCVVPNRIIRKISVDPQVGLTLHAREKDRMIKLGFGNYSGKLEGLQKIMTHPRVRDAYPNFTAIDLMNPNRIVVFPAQAPLSGDEKKETKL